MQEKKIEAKKKDKQCPFNPNLKCEDCRFYRVFIGCAEGERLCSIIRIAGMMPL